MNLLQKLSLTLHCLPTKPFSIEPCFADKAEAALVEFNASIMLIVSL
jgi:hypothetical protein